MALPKIVTQSDPVALAASLRPLLLRNALETESKHRLPDENVHALEAMNLFKVMVPRRWGGYGTPLKTVLATFAEVAKGCGSSGWVTMIIGGVNWYASRLPDAGQEELFAGNPAVRACSAAGAAGSKGQQVEGGVHISGRFPFASGCLHSSWAGLTTEIKDEADTAVDYVTAFAPISELEIEDTWNVAGMCGTSSNTLVARDVFIPSHRILPFSKLLKGERLSQRHAGEPSDNYGFMSANSIIGLAPIIGIAQVLLESVVAGTQTRAIAFTSYTRQADAPMVQHQMAEASLQIDTAWLLAERAADEIEACAAAGEQMPYLNRAHVRGAIGFAAKLLREAIDTLVSVAGASGFHQSSPVQRMWRDASIALRHPLVMTDPNLEIYGRALLGVESNITPLV